MNNGIALIIPNADFSGSPLGQVTFVKNPTEIVDEYLTKVGVEKNRLELTTLYRKLSELGVIETIDIFPMLGNSLSNRTIGLKPVGEEFLASSLVVGANATAAAGDYGISFADTNPNFTGSETGYIEKKLSSPEGIFMFMKLIPRRLGQGFCATYLLGDNKDTGFYDIVIESVQSDNSYSYHPVLEFFQRGKTKTYNSVFDSLETNSPQTITGTYNNGGLLYLVQGYQLEQILSVAPLVYANPIWLHNMFGGRVDEVHSHFFNADVELFAIGYISDSNKFNAVANAFIEYVSD